MLGRRNRVPDKVKFYIRYDEEGHPRVVPVSDRPAAGREGQFPCRLRRGARAEVALQAAVKRLAVGGETAAFG